MTAYQAYLHGWRWWLIRSFRLWLDGYKCQTCHAWTKLQVHHASYAWRGRGGISGMYNELCDTVTLCDTCHEAVHKNRNIRDFAD